MYTFQRLHNFTYVYLAGFFLSPKQFNHRSRCFLEQKALIGVIGLMREVLVIMRAAVFWTL